MLPHVHVFYLQTVAVSEMWKWVESHFSEVDKVYKKDGKVVCKNGEVHLFMGAYVYDKWYRGRTYIIEGKKYHSDEPMES